VSCSVLETTLGSFVVQGFDFGAIPFVRSAPKWADRWAFGDSGFRHDLADAASVTSLVDKPKLTRCQRDVKNGGRFCLRRTITLAIEEKLSHRRTQVFHNIPSRQKPENSNNRIDIDFGF